jgi:uncharacterized membrane protein YbhN (UPF0104 family)
MTRRVLLVLASVGLGAVLIVLLARLGHIDLRLTLHQLQRVRPLDFLRLVLLNVLMIYISTEKWRSVDAVLRRPSDSVPSRFASFTTSSAGIALGLLLPVQIGMATARTLGTYVHGRPLRRGTAGTLLEQGFDFLIVVSLSVASAATWLYHGGGTMWMLSALAMVLLALLAAEPTVRLLRWLAASVTARTGESQNRVLRALREIEHSRLLSAALARRLVILSAFRFGVVVLMAAQTAEAVHANIPLWQMAAAVPFVVIATVIAVTPGGIGVNELTSVTALHVFGTPLTVAAQWSVANRVLCTAACFLVAGSAIALGFVVRIIFPARPKTNLEEI